MWYNIENVMPMDGDDVIIEYKDIDGSLSYGKAKTEAGLWVGVDDPSSITRWSMPPKPDHVQSVDEFLNQRHAMHLNVGELKKYIEDLPDDTLVVYQRIEDSQFGRGGWSTVNVLWNGKRTIQRGDDTYYHYPDEYTECVPAFSCYHWKGVLVIHAHY